MTFWGKKNDYWGKKITFWGKNLFHSASHFKNCTNGKLPDPGRLRPSRRRFEGRKGGGEEEEGRSRRNGQRRRAARGSPGKRKKHVIVFIARRLSLIGREKKRMAVGEMKRDVISSRVTSADVTVRYVSSCHVALADVT